jgi:hypothetical protein
VRISNEKLAQWVEGSGDGLLYDATTLELVVVATAPTFVLEVARFVQLCNDPLGCPFCDPDAHCHSAKCRVRGLRDTEEDMCVVGEERPFGVHRRTSLGACHGTIYVLRFV